MHSLGKLARFMTFMPKHGVKISDLRAFATFSCKILHNKATIMRSYSTNATQREKINAKTENINDKGSAYSKLLKYSMISIIIAIGFLIVAAATYPTFPSKNRKKPKSMNLISLTLQTIYRE